jgi:hypothetical protein
MRMTRRSALALAAFAVLVAAAVFARWFQMQRAAPAPVASNAVITVSSPADHGPGTLREALFLAASAAHRTSIVITTSSIAIESALPPLVSAQGISVESRPSGARIDARALNGGPVFDVAGANISIEGLHVLNCPAAAVLVRAARFRLEMSTIESCDVGVEVAGNAADTLLTRNRFTKNRVSVRFASAAGNSSVDHNQFSQDRDAALWAVRGAMDGGTEPVKVHDNHFANEPTGIVAGNVPVLVERNDFSNSRAAAVHLVGAAAMVRGNRISGGESMGVVAEGARDAVIEANEIDGFKAYGIMVRGSANTLVRSNRIHNSSYGIAFVLGQPGAPSTAVENIIMEPQLNGIDVLGDSPILRRNQVIRPHGVALHVESFRTPDGRTVPAQPFLDDNTFGAGGAPLAGATPPAGAAASRK